MSSEPLPRAGFGSGDLGALLAASVAGDRRAFEELVERHKNLVWSVIRVLGLRGPDAEDVFQVVFVRLYERQASIRDGSRLPGWLATTTRRECYDTIRRRHRTEATMVDELVDPAQSFELAARLIEDEQQRALADAYAALSEPCRNLLRLLAAEPALSYDDITEVLGIPRGGIGPTRQRCIEKLRRHPAMRRIREEPT
jgi:RNA polymerase sigma factor (sigma-70 family)